MEDKIEDLELQEIQEVVEEETVTLSKAELEDLKHKATVSSQNYARLKKLEEENKTLKSLETPVLSELEDDRYSQLESEVSEMKTKLSKSEVTEAYPAIKELWSDFETYLADPENAGMPMKTAARVFLSEKGVLKPKRLGLEHPTGGSKAPLSTGMSTEDVKRLRETDFKKYTTMLKKGQLKFS